MELNAHDVLMGRGSHSTGYEGNLRFRQLVREHREEYMRYKQRKHKNRIAEEIIAAVQQQGGRFLQRIESLEEADRLGVPPRTQAWKVIPINSALYIKVKQLMRDIELTNEQKRRAQREEARNAIRNAAAAAAAPKTQEETAPVEATERQQVEEDEKEDSKPRAFERDEASPSSRTSE